MDLLPLFLLARAPGGGQRRQGIARQRRRHQELAGGREIAPAPQRPKGGGEWLLRGRRLQLARAYSVANALSRDVFMHQ